MRQLARQTLRKSRLNAEIPLLFSFFRAVFPCCCLGVKKKHTSPALHLPTNRSMSYPVRWFQGYFLAEQPVGSTLADLTWEISPRSTLNRLKQQEIKLWDAVYYGTLFFFLGLSFYLNSGTLVARVGVALLLSLSLVVPVTSQFFLYGLPVLTWAFFLFSSKTITAPYRPPITVKVLPALETVFYGDNLSQLLSTYTSSVLDILAWLPYGIIHFSLPFVVAALIFLWGPPTSLRSFGFAFGIMNLIGVVIQLIFPAAPPWYKILHELDPANYSMLGSPGGLARIDTLLHLDMYTTNFSKNSPVVFGAFPSLHSGSATMDALFLSWLFPRGIPFFVAYVMWLWWSTMYLTHHYFIDLTAGSFLALVVFAYTKYTHLPVNDKNARNRWSYANVHKLDMFRADPLVFAEDEETTLTRSRTQSIVRTQFEMDVLQRAQRTTTTADTNDSSPELTSVFEQARPSSRLSTTSNTSVTTVESQFDLSMKRVD